MDDLTTLFEQHRDHLRAVAYRMLGSRADADDAVQETWLRLNGSDVAGVDNLGGWLTTVTSRICLNVLRARRTHGEEPLDHPGRLPEPEVFFGEPEEQAMLADSVGLALLVVLDQLSPAERLAFVLHDLFAVPFEEIAPIVGRSHDATRQLASRARRRVQGAAPVPDRDLGRQRVVVDAFFAAAREGDLEGLVAVLDPDVVLRADDGATVRTLTGAQRVAGSAIMYAHPERVVHPALVNGAAGVVVTLPSGLFSVMAFTVVDGRVVEIETFTDPALLARLREELDLG